MGKTSSETKERTETPPRSEKSDKKRKAENRNERIRQRKAIATGFPFHIYLINRDRGRIGAGETNRRGGGDEPLAGRDSRDLFVSQVVMGDEFKGRYFHRNPEKI